MDAVVSRKELRASIWAPFFAPHFLRKAVAANFRLNRLSWAGLPEFRSKFAK